MGFARILRRFVNMGVRQRGDQYYRSGAVRITRADRWQVDALVAGTEEYRVRLIREKKTVSTACTCPYFRDRDEPCKHIWATLLKAEARGFLSGPGDLGPMLLRIANGPNSRPDDHGRNGNGRPRTNPGQGQRPPSGGKKSKKKRGSPSHPWKQSLDQLRAEMERAPLKGVNALPGGRHLFYVVDAERSRPDKGLVVELLFRLRRRNGSWGKPKRPHLTSERVAALPDNTDRQILALLDGSKADSENAFVPTSPVLRTRHQLSTVQQQVLVPMFCQTGRCQFRRSRNEPEPRTMHWDDGPAWEFWLELRPDPDGQHYQLAGSLRRENERIPLTKPDLVMPGGLVFWDGHVARLQDFDAFSWINWLRRQTSLTVSTQQMDELLQDVLRLPRLPRLDLPPDMDFLDGQNRPRFRLTVKSPSRPGWDSRLTGELSFDYEGMVVARDQPGRGLYQPDKRRVLLRNRAAEEEAVAKLEQLGFREGPTFYGAKPDLLLAASRLPAVVHELLTAGWHIEAEGKLYRQPGIMRMQVSSHIDWFELHGSVDFEGQKADLPLLLAALKRGEKTVVLSDGTVGVLPEEWLKKYGLIAGLGKVEGNHLRFARSQAGLLDALVASQPEASWDEAFASARSQLRHFEGIVALDPPDGFVGQLRAYQREGLGWLQFLHRFGFGGCLADDMGLGKTVQVLAMLENRREQRAQGNGQRVLPALVVVPKSLVFNWQEEAARFTPQLKILDHTGMGRTKPGAHFLDYDLILTTYGTLRRDAAEFRECAFDYAILDEAQAIKNASTASAKAARLLRAEHRLVLSGTPVENHLGELWSLFEFLNPGMLGTASVFQLTGAGGRNPSDETRSLLAKALRPFILRRTKDQVAKDLPAKSEQTIHCELDGPQRKRYDELRDHYRKSLLGRIEREGINRAKIEVLEALLRLRQAACHPGLIDQDRVAENSAKLDNLLPLLAEVLDGGHKALVFSQFTSFLAILRDRLDQQGVPYEYLDGRTRDRAKRVEKFQYDPECKLFLISLKAGGMGLNLTAAEYVFLLDPWWNPAVEAQAIDRAHRIGQTQPVFAYRLIAKDTVEEKVLELQKSKRALADAIINADNSLIRQLGRDDLELLLS